MGVLTDFINKFKSQKENKKHAQMLNGYAPIFSQFGTDIYASDVVQQAISCIVQEMKKLTPMHIRKKGNESIPVNDSLQTLLNEPNERMTTSDFIEKIFWQLFLNFNSFIIPTYTTTTDKDGYKVKNYTGLYPIQPINVEILQDTAGNLFYKFKFLNNYETTLRFSDVIHIKYRFSVNEFMGGNEYGQPDNKALLKTLELNNTLLEGVAKALKSSFAINGVVKYNTLIDDGTIENNIKELEKKLRDNESGLLGMDIKGEFIPLQNKVQLVDDTTLKFIDEKILRHFGVSLPVLTGDYSKAQYEAFYQKTLEPLIINIGQAFTKILFTSREKGFGNEIKFYPHELIFMDSSQKLELFDLLVDSASCYKNELRTAFGMSPLPELAGELAVSSNKTNAENNKTDDGTSTKDEEDKVDDDQENNNVRSIHIDHIENVFRYNPNHEKDGKFCPTHGGSGSSGDTTVSGVKKEVYSKENVDANVKKVRETASNTYKPFKKESVNVNKVKERGGCNDKDTKTCVDLAEKVYGKAAKAEPQITKDIVDTVAENGGKMYGLDFRMKQPTSMAGKIAADVKLGEAASFEQSASSIKDSVRYTALFETNKLTSGYNSVKQSMEEKGYTETRCKNFFTYYKDGKSSQKAVQCTYTDKDGFTFEFQFHTYETQGAKEVNHPLYEEARNVTTSNKRASELNAAMKIIGSYSEVPEGVYDIKDHK